MWEILLHEKIPKSWNLKLKISNLEARIVWDLGIPLKTPKTIIIIAIPGKWLNHDCYGLKYISDVSQTMETEFLIK